jgi:starch synthase
MNVLFVSAEVAPFAKAGGLGDVVGSLPKALRQHPDRPVDARVLMPLYGTINRAKYRLEHRFNFQLNTKSGNAEVSIFKTVHEGVPIYFLSSWPFFGEGNYIYSDWNWDMPRFIFFSQAILGAAWYLGQGWDGGEPWFPDVLHANDWHTALSPFLVDVARLSGAPWNRVGTVLSLHNMAYQGPFGAKFLADAGIPERKQADVVYQNLGDNLLGIGLGYADQINTVSPRHALEIQYPRFGEGLEGMLRVRQDDLYGILNGMDMEHNDPATDPALPTHYDVTNFEAGKTANKTALQQDLGLDVRPDTPLIGLVTRLVEQKGVDLAVPALRRIAVEYDVQFVALGSGESKLESDLWWLAHDFSFKGRGILSYDPVLAQRIYAASDLFLMPSRYEPCGTSQMLAMRYGSLPVVRETGGLADTVENYDNGDGAVGTGFSFLWEEVDAVIGTLRWALDTYRTRRDVFRKLQRRAMQRDFNWQHSVPAYLAMYDRALARHR